MPIMSRAEIEQRLTTFNGWRYDGHAIVREYKFGSFPDAIQFVNRLVPGAESADHHPDITIQYSRVTLSYSTNSQGGVTAKDFDGARTADRLVHP